MPPASVNPDPFSDPKKSFSTPVIFHTRFQTWPLKSRPVVSPGITINDVIVS